MEVKQGFKETELGIIPEDWEVKKFFEVMDGFSSGQTPYRGIPEFYKGDIPWITSGELNYNVITDTIEKITPEGAKEANLKRIPKGTFLFAITGLEAAGTRGSCAIAGIEATTNQSCMALYPKKDFLTTAYLYHYYVKYGNELALKYCQGTKQQSYTGGIAKKLPIIIPPTIKEQTAIANALSDMDALIAQTEKLIEKKKAIKQGVMQELLKPKEGWVTKKLGEVVEKITTGKLDANAMKRDGDYRFYTCAKEYYFIDKYAFDDEALLISGNGANVGYIHYYKGKFNAYQRTYVLTGFEMNIAFIKIYLDKYLSDRIATEVSAGNTPYIKMDTISEMNICYPERTVEQESISSIINDLTREFDKLETKLQKLKLQKQGMMQALLTGKIRLV
jgi:type I restriction enzyme S subunit